jgi:uncharacterized protein YqhQ
VLANLASSVNQQPVNKLLSYPTLPTTRATRTTPQLDLQQVRPRLHGTPNTHHGIRPLRRAIGRTSISSKLLVSAIRAIRTVLVIPAILAIRTTITIQAMVMLTLLATVMVTILATVMKLRLRLRPRRLRVIRRSLKQAR